jgi:eukaryotic-like serine/threonine-protein kinase
MERDELDRRRHIDRVFRQLLELGDAARERRLRELRAEDPELYHELQGLLSFLGEDLTRFEDDLNSIPSRLLRDVSQEQEDKLELASGDQIPGYTILRRLGRGGSGSLFLARRSDGIGGDVAIKVLRRGIDTADVLDRFRAEREILASLDHPNIIPFRDAGSTEDGRPFLVMSFVDGKPITDYCRERELSIQGRLALFMQVCEAVRYAHEGLVVHRDLKPANILVDRSGTVRLLDFGIAKLLDSRKLGTETPRTRTGIRLYTPQFAAPEQVRGERATTAIDIYQLGHLLYQLLTGSTPFPEAETGSSIADLQAAILGTAPSPPSRRLKEAEELALQGTGTVAHPWEREWREIRGDLDTITLRAMHREPARRYPSVEALQDDVRAYLEGRPVSARPDSLAYRAGKFVRRHPWRSLALGILAVASAGYLVLISIYSAQLQREQARVQLEADRAEEVTTFLTQLFEAPGEQWGDTLTARALLERGVERVESDFDGRPNIQATLLGTMADSYRSLGLRNRAIPLRERQAELLASHQLDPDELALSLTVLGDLLRETGELEQAQAVLLEARDLRAELDGEGSPAWASTLNNLGLVAHARGDWETARDYFQEAIRVHRSDHGGSREALAINLSNLGRTHLALNEASRAIAYLEESLAIRDELELSDDGRGATYNVLGVTYRRMGDYEAAEEAFRNSVAVRRSTLARAHPDLANSLGNLGSILRLNGNLEEAQEVHEEALAIRQELYGPDHPSVGAALNSLGGVHESAGNHEVAESLLREAIQLYINHLGEEHSTVAVARNNLARAIQAQGRYEEAEALFHLALEGMEATLGVGGQAALTVRHNLGRLYLDWDRPGMARAALEEALEGRTRLLGQDHPEVQETEELLTQVSPSGP